MISVLIPVYNFNIYSLVSILHKQLEAGGAFEIIIMDDASNEEYRAENRLLQKMDFVRYIQLEQNIGRARIRNELAKQAQYGYLLFLDCDSGIIGDSFIKNYMDKCSGEHVICGGRVYPELPPGKQYMLHWLYGTKKESLPLKSRLNCPYKSFMTHNFLISKSIFNRISFDEELSGYGHEDTLFGCHLKEQCIFVDHIENPVMHLQIETSVVFLMKTHKALDNLKGLYVKYQGDKSFLNSIKILRLFKKIKRLGLLRMFCFFGKLISPMLFKNLSGVNPKLFFFDLYKLFYLSNLK